MDLKSKIIKELNLIDGDYYKDEILKAALLPIMEAFNIDLVTINGVEYTQDGCRADADDWVF